MSLNTPNAIKNITIDDVSLCMKKNDFVKAEELCRELIKQDPKNADALYFLGFMQLNFNKITESKKSFSDAIAFSEEKLGGWCLSIADSYAKMALNPDAIFYYKKALQLMPEKQHNIYNKIGIIYRQEEDFDKAIECYKAALDFMPNYIVAMCNLAFAYKEKGDFVEAENLCRKAISLKPDFVQASYYLGLVFMDQNKPLEALPYIKNSLDLNPDFIDPYRAYAFCLLGTKNFEMGWEAYEKRYLGMDTPKPAGDKPMWEGESLDGKRIYVFHEQGLGDTIQFMRYLPELKKSGAKVFFKPQPELENLIRHSDLDIELVDQHNYLKEDEFDNYSRLLSLPYRLNANDNIPLSKGYLKANPEKISEYYEKYFKNTDKFKVGIFWQGSSGFTNDKKRSTKLEYFYKLAKMKKVQLYSLQKGFGEEQLENLPDDISIIKLGDTFEDFGDTAAAIENLDLVISVDSSVAHLAGALGKPVWILLPYVWEWRWFGSEDKTPWYESMKIFHQKQANDWENLFKKVSGELKKLSKS